MGRADVHEKKVRSVGRWQLELSYCLAMHKSTVAPHWLAPLLFRFASCLVFLLTAEEAKHVASTTWPEMYANRRNFRAFREIGVEKHDGDVRFKSGSGNMTVSCMRNASGHNYRNSSVIVDLAMGQIPRSTECISFSSLPKK